MKDEKETGNAIALSRASNFLALLPFLVLVVKIYNGT